MVLSPGATIAALGVAQTIAWGSTYYLPAVLATPMAESLGTSAVGVFGAFTVALVVSALVGPWAGARIDRLGGRGVLMLSNLVFAAGLGLLAAAPSATVLWLGWGVIGLGMGMGLYEAAFATLAAIHGRGARAPITGITLIAGFASTVGWPLSGLMLAHWGWREACLGWAAIHLAVALPLNALLPRPAAPTAPAPEAAAPAEGPAPPTGAMALLAFVFAATWFSSTAMAAHLPRLLEAAGSSPALAIAAGALIGPAQVAARVLEYGLLSRVHPLVSARLAAAAHPAAAVVLLALGGPAAAIFAILHGAGNGILTIAKGTLPLALFGPAGYGQRLGWLGAPARVLQAAAPLVFGAALSAWGAQAVWLTATLGAAAVAALSVLRRTAD
jgi:MFS family permease